MALGVDGAVSYTPPMPQSRLSLWAFGLSLFGLGLSTLLRVLPMIGWQPSILTTILLLIFSVGCMLAGLSIFASLLIPAEASVRVLAAPAFVSRNRNVLLFWLLGFLVISFITWQSLTIYRLQSAQTAKEWPRLTSAQVAALKAGLEKLGPHTFWVTCAAIADREFMAVDLDSVLADAHWNRKFPVDVSMDGETVGIAVYGKNATLADTVRQLIKNSTGFAVHRGVHGDTQPSASLNVEIEIAVGARPVFFSAN
jgi:hypothetical protein